MKEFEDMDILVPTDDSAGVGDDDDVDDDDDEVRDGSLPDLEEDLSNMI